MSSKAATPGAVLQVSKFTSQLRTFDPFLFCAYHNDKYPQSASAGSEPADMGPDRSLLRGRNIGSDFSGKDGWSMYHGSKIPGFPSHPHYGFETITVVRKGVIDHFDSHGNTARYGNGDMQFLTAGAGIQHSEMFPMVNADKPNHLELFQLWLNLPQAKKRSKPFFAMAWDEQQPTKTVGEPGKQAHLKLIVGTFDGLVGVPAPPDSYASDPKSEVVVATLKLEPGSSYKLPPASSSEINRAIYLFNGSHLKVESKVLEETSTMVKLLADREVDLEAVGSGECEVLIIQGRPLNEPVVQHGPFVTGSEEELMQVMMNYQRTHFGGWKWGPSDKAHPRTETRFFEIDGKRVTPSAKN